MAEVQGTFNVLFVGAQQTRPYKMFADTLQTRLSGFSQLRFSTFTGTLNKNIQYDLLILGGKSNHPEIQLLKQTTPTVYTLVSKHTYQNILLQESSKQPRTAIFIEQSYDRQFDALHYTFPKLKTIGVIYSDTTQKAIPEIKAASSKYQFNLIARKIQDPSNIFPVIVNLSGQADALFAIPDPEIYNRNTAQNILLTTYKSHIPLIAYSSSYVKAGALFSVYSTPEQFAFQAADIAVDFLLNGKTLITDGSYPQYYSVQANYPVARSLGIEISDVYPDKPE